MTDEWTVSSELSLEVRPDAVDVIAAKPPMCRWRRPSRPFGAKSDVALGLCEFTHRGTTLATATVRSFYISAPGHLADFPDGPIGPMPSGTLSDRMAVRVAESGGAAKALQQLPDPVLNNSLGIVHGGVSAMALELVASAAINAGRDEHATAYRIAAGELHPPVLAGSPESRYVGTALRVGRRSGIGEAQAIGPDGRGGHRRAPHRLRLELPRIHVLQGKLASARDAGAADIVGSRLILADIRTHNIIQTFAVLTHTVDR